MTGVILFSYCLLCMVVVQWIQTWRLYGRFSEHLAWLMVRYALRSARRLMFLASCAGLGSTLLMVVAPGSLPPLPVPFLLAISLAGLTGAILPPAVLVLGSSTPAAGLVVSRLFQAITPLRLAHLLDTTAARGTAFSGIDLTSTSVRTGSFPWRTLVSDFMEIVPLVVVDLRAPTSAVAEEAAIAARDYGFKSFFLADGGDGARLLFQLRDAVSWPLLSFASVDEMADAVRARAWSARVARIADPFRSPHFGRLEAPPPAGTAPPLPAGEGGEGGDGACAEADEDATHPWRDPEAGFSMQLPAGWKPTRLRPDFVAAGGRLAVARVGGGGTLNVSVGPLEHRTHEARPARQALLEAMVSRAEFSGVRIATGVVQGEPNSVGAAWHEADGSQAGLITAVRDGVEYVIEWKAGPDQADAAQASAASFRLDRVLAGT